MVFPSRACKTCKKRRVKCDELRPSCGRCVKAKYPCGWDTKGDELLPFRSENEFASGRPRRQRSRKKRVSISIAAALSPSLETLCFNFWVENFAPEPSEPSFDLGIEYESQVVSRWSSIRPGSSLQFALSAVAHIAFGRAKRTREAIYAAKHLYYNAIFQVQKDIRTALSGNIDHLLLAMMLLGSIERCMPWCTLPTSKESIKGLNVPGSRFWSNAAHHKGATGVLKLRPQRNTTTCAPLDAVVRRQVTQTLILSGGAAPSWFCGDTNEQNCPAKSLDMLILRTAQLRASSLFLVGQANENRPRGCCSVAMSAAQDVLREALQLEDDFASWPDNLPDEWQYTMTRSVPTSDAVSNLGVGSLIHSYSSYRYCTAWNNYRAARLIANSIALRAMQLTGSEPVHYSGIEAEKRLHGNVYLLASDLCSGVRSLFGDSNSRNERGLSPKIASLLAWPLTVAFGIDSIPQPQKTWLTSKLKTVAEVMGDDMLQSMVEYGGFKF